ncbi:hypothetical protein SODALDRAFT_347843 [Sodiomyces alkalinus F11]|uniref:Uncharacterized protein n=1 Tax=Sodiomyces alkalinus (strain CBS 110278 / VKM F-3762 / F11) TaxID=1314773 RepID=A0A3N2Q8E4_SODAK|nr:hypothetical protein SODALDRAFT_347843 [Sodiomyces alkalinus F11]ROT43010.1 hypothetical protein SODALDRAFT_347843 [Sodiomyces alkalinus F11]
MTSLEYHRIPQPEPSIDTHTHAHTHTTPQQPTATLSISKVQNSNAERQPESEQHDEVCDLAGRPMQQRNDNGDNGTGSAAHQFQGLAATRRPRKASYFRVLVPWATSAAFVVAVYAVLIGYSSKSVVTKTQKRQFNAIITGLLIALGLSTASLLTDMATDLRWWILSRRYRSRRKVESILHAHSVRRVIMLSARSSRASIHVAVASWILLLIASQIGFASVNLCYAFEPSESVALLSPGNVSIANVSDIETAKIVKSSTSRRAQQYTAHSFGTMSLAYDTAVFPDAKMPTPGELWYTDDPLMFCDSDSDSCQYVFHETNPESLNNPDALPITVSTNRVIHATTECTSWPVVSGGGGTEANITILLPQDQARIIPLPAQAGPDQTTFITDTGADCGRGCGTVTAFEASDTYPWFYSCNTTIGTVENAEREEHHVGENLGRMATVAIALQGYPNNLTTTESPGVQSVIFPAQSIFGMPLGGAASSMAFLLSRFAIGVVAMAAESNDMVVVPGDVPTVGLELHVEHWNYIHVILFLALGLQLLLGFGAAWVANTVVIPGGGPVAEAQVIRAMVARPSSLNGRRDGAGGKGSSGKSVWIYRDVHVGNGVHDLYMKERVVSAERCRPGQAVEVQEKREARSEGHRPESNNASMSPELKSKLSREIMRVMLWTNLPAS